MKNHGWYHSAKPFFAVAFLQFGLAGMDILSKAALNQGMSNYVLVVYRHAVATAVIAPFAVFLDRKTRPKMTLSIFIKIVALGLLEPVIDQNFYFLGMKYTTATFAAAMCNILPAITFVMACFLRLEKVKLRSIRSQAKIFGTLATVAGAMIMTLIKGPVVELFGKKGRTFQDQQRSEISLRDSIRGSLMITIGCFSWACFMNLQAITLKTYPAELSLTAWICLMGTIEGSAVALVMERGNNVVWDIKWGTKLLAAVYSGIFCSGLAYYIQGVVMKDKGPVFVTAFNPLSMVIVAVMSTLILGECLYFGRIFGAAVIIVGLYMVIWGKSNDEDATNPSTEELALPTKQTNATSSDGKEIVYPEVVAVEVSGCGTVTKNDTADKGGPKHCR